MREKSSYLSTERLYWSNICSYFSSHWKRSKILKISILYTHCIFILMFPWYACLGNLPLPHRNLRPRKKAFYIGNAESQCCCWSNSIGAFFGRANFLSPLICALLIIWKKLTKKTELLQHIAWGQSNRQRPNENKPFRNKILRTYYISPKTKHDNN